VKKKGDSAQGHGWYHSRGGKREREGGREGGRGGERWGDRGGERGGGGVGTEWEFQSLCMLRQPNHPKFATSSGASAMFWFEIKGLVLV
jgi:hypothetical protein